MPISVFGLPLHPLIVHATVVFVPLAAFAVLMAGVWPAFRRWAGPLPLAVALVALVLDPISTSSGENLERELPHSALIERHSQLADGLLPWVIGLAVVAAALAWVWFQERAVSATPARVSAPRVALVWAAAALAVVAATGTTVQVVRIGHSGAQAAWSDVKPPQGGAMNDG